jgi:hypothetical protein
MSFHARASAVSGRMAAKDALFVTVSVDRGGGVKGTPATVTAKRGMRSALSH